MMQVLLPMSEKDIEILAVCDAYEDRAQKAADDVFTKTGVKPFAATDYHELLKMEELNAVIITTSWETHTLIAVDAMKAGKWVGLDVGGSYDIRECWRLVETSEETGMPCMLMENCCYGQRELMVLNMAKKGILGEIVHGSGGYGHDLRHEIAYGKENRHYRLRNYLNRNCDNYPTHALVPLGKVLDINHGNRMLTLTSVASAAKGLHQYILENKSDDTLLASSAVAQGDVVTTTIRCARGETITIVLDTTLPRYYSRGFTVHGTKGMYTEENDSVFLDGQHNESEFDWKPHFGNAAQYAEQYDHPLWKAFKKNTVGGHGGMDWLVFRAFFESVKHGTPPPIDVYDAALYMSVSALSERSAALGGAPVEIPDFTRGRWIEREEPQDNWFALRHISDKPLGELW